MLNLNRKEGQSILIGEGDSMVTVRINKVLPLHNGGYDVILGCDAPNEVSIDREEVRERRIKHINGAFNGNR